MAGRFLSHPADSIEHMFDLVDAAGEASADAAESGVRLRLVDLPTDHDRLAALEAAGPSAGGYAVLDRIDLDALDAHDRVTALALWDRQRGWADARTQQALVAVGGPPPTEERRDDFAREQIACALRLSSGTAGSRLDVARELCGRLAQTRQAMERGLITYWHARYLADQLACRPDELAAVVQAQMLTGGHVDETLTNWRKRLDRAVIAADPATADQRHELAVSARRVECYRQAEGMATIAATVTADEAMTTMRALTAIANRAKTEHGDHRPVDIRRADAFARLFAAALADPKLPTEQRARPAVGISIDYPTLVKLADHPAHLDGYGPIPPAMARRIAAGGDWHRLVTDPITGALLDYGRATYRPPTELAEFLIARDRTCRFPTCNRPARNCDIDHAPAWDDGGTTSAATTGALCRRNHRQKTHAGWRLRAHPDGSATFTSPTGHTYHRPTIDHCPEHTAYLKALRERDGDPPDEWDPESAQFRMTNIDEPDAATPENPPDPGRATPPGPGTLEQLRRYRRSTSDNDASSGNDPPPF